eukprot:CAMPEP_0202443316 /NCGR_PEP_ID=MMETSP1360-20130828/2632_1 /ASSEMBLY_ACC=CAM_ASM_000848 /TAXON_ID=515479 /ORGANISM="Licmophora paradoxa, Strain CCMP2313" /LENGTH=650 /DNA_ID=CAMNT_0049058985 /DNA_START=13 /DNA_END=1965 /DNA_ORIENTATION=-
METIDEFGLTMSNSKLDSPRNKSSSISPRRNRPPVGVVAFDSRDDVSTSFFSIVDEENEYEEQGEPLTWRGHPSTTMSDCELVVTNEEDLVPVAEHYHVHRAMLGASDRRCQYFYKLYKSGNGIETKSYKIMLEYRGANEAIPNLLDFIYFGELDIASANAVPLRHLATFFQCKPLRLAVNKFIEQDFNMDTALHYVQSTFHYKDSALLKLAISETAKIFDQIKDNHFVDLSPELLCEIITSEDLVSEQENKLSEVIVNYLSSNPNNLTAKLLYRLTEEIPTIKPEEARVFLELVQQIDPDDPIEDSESWRALTLLCFRCANALAPVTWKEDPTDLQKDFFVNKWKEDGHSRLLIAKLVFNLKYAQEQCKSSEELQEIIDKSRNEITDYQNRVSELVSTLEKSQEVVRSKDEAIHDLNRVQKSLQKTIVDYKEKTQKLEKKLDGMDLTLQQSNTKIKAQEVAIENQRHSLTGGKGEVKQLEKKVSALSAENSALEKKLESQKVDYETLLKAQAMTKPTKVTNNKVGGVDKEYGEERREPPSGVDSVVSSDSSEPPGANYKEMRKDEAVKLAKELKGKEIEIMELKQQLELKNLQLEKTEKVMTHLNARLRFYEILHDKKPPSGKSPSPTKTRGPPGHGSRSVMSRFVINE